MSAGDIVTLGWLAEQAHSGLTMRFEEPDWVGVLRELDALVGP